MMTMRNNIGNILKVIHSTGCNLQIAEEALEKCNTWPNTIKYAREACGTTD